MSITACAWPKLQSLDEDERDRSVVVVIKYLNDITPGVVRIQLGPQPNLSPSQWKSLFDQAYPRAAVLYATGAFLNITGDYGPGLPSKVKGVDIPLSVPYSWQNRAPTRDDVMKAIRPTIIKDVEQQFAAFESRHPSR